MRRPEAGFTLSELLVALALGSVLTGALLASAGVAGRRHAEIEQIARLQERGEHALGLLEPELQLAGFGGLSPLAAWQWLAGAPARSNSCATLVLPSPVALTIDTAYLLPCAAQGGGAAIPSDVVTVLRAGARSTVPDAGRLQVLTSRLAAETPRVLVDGRLASGLPLVEGLRELRDVELASFYVSRDSDGTPGLPALRAKSLTAIDGHATFVDQELVAGVEMICVETTASTEHGVSFTHAPAAFLPAHLPGAVRVSVLLRTERPWGVERDQTIGCAGRHVTRHDAYQRLLVTRVWAIRNGRSPEGAS